MKMRSVLELRTFTDGGQSALEVADEVAGFIRPAQRSLDFAHYDFHLSPEPAAVVAEAIRAAAGRGVAVRFIYNLDHRNPIPVPPPPEPDGVLIDSLGVPVRPIAGVPDLMHHKFVVRDGSAVFTGSMNWTDDSWTVQENVVALAESHELAARFIQDFEQLWETGAVEQSGLIETTPVPVGEHQVRTWFTPGHGEDLSQRIADAILKARRRVRIASPVITAAPVLAALAEVISEARVDVAGCVDRPQIDGVIYQWGENGNIFWKLPLLERVLTAPFSAKPSTPWEPTGSLHNFMHAKLTVADDTIFVGSFNLSRSGEQNAENVLEVTDPDLAERLAGFVDQTRALYPRYTATPTRSSTAASS